LARREVRSDGGRHDHTSHFSEGRTAAVASGIVFCGCGLLQGAHAQQPARQKLPVMVVGKKIKTIDVHAHCHFREALRSSERMPPKFSYRQFAAQLRLLSKSISGSQQWMHRQSTWKCCRSIRSDGHERDLAGQVVKIQNEKMGASLSDDEKADILGRNAAKLLNLSA
jgi:hypothetical protein